MDKICLPDDSKMQQSASHSPSGTSHHQFACLGQHSLLTELGRNGDFHKVNPSEHAHWIFGQKIEIASEKQKISNFFELNYN